MKVKCQCGHFHITMTLPIVLCLLLAIMIEINIVVMQKHRRFIQENSKQNRRKSVVTSRRRLPEIFPAGHFDSLNALKMIQNEIQNKLNQRHKKTQRISQEEQHEAMLPQHEISGRVVKGSWPTSPMHSSFRKSRKVPKTKESLSKIRTMKSTPVHEPKNNERTKKKQKREPRIIEPRPLSLAPNATVSACLLVRDDNDILPEWLAYHYHTIGLRDLIVAVDPLSVESPSEIFMKWRLMTNLRILEWSDADYMPQEFLVHKRPPEEYMQKPQDFPDPEALLEVSNHRYRQRVFVAMCMRRFRKDGRSWVLHTDTDEFIVPSKLLRQMNPKYLTIPSMEEPNAVLTLLQETVNKTFQQVNYPCLSLLRVLFGSVESTLSEQEKDVPAPFLAKSFETLRWRYHALPHNMTLHGNPKVLLDVAAIPEHYFHEDVVFSIHRPVKRFCHVNTELSYTHFRQQPIGVNHYLGTWERYAGRNDKRRTREVYESKAKVKRGSDDGVRLWLQGFCNNVGQHTAETLLGKSYLRQPIQQTETETKL